MPLENAGAVSIWRVWRREGEWKVWARIQNASLCAFVLLLYEKFRVISYMNWDLKDRECLLTPKKQPSA